MKTKYPELEDLIMAIPPPPDDWVPPMPKKAIAVDKKSFVKSMRQPKKHQKVYDYPVWPTILNSDKPTIRPIQIISEKRVPKKNRKIAEWDGQFDRYIIFKNISNPKYPPYFICPIPNDKSPLQYFGSGLK